MGLLSPECRTNSVSKAKGSPVLRDYIVFWLLIKDLDRLKSLDWNVFVD